MASAVILNAVAAAAGRGHIRDGVGGVWKGLGRYLEAVCHGRGGGCVVRWATNGEKRALSSKILLSAPMVFKTTTGELRALGL
eukprot:scaffold23809_cov62-Cyclotella_meneghiniana.AAC.10